MGEREGSPRGRGDIYIYIYTHTLVADSCYCIAETNTTSEAIILQLKINFTKLPPRKKECL